MEIERFDLDQAVAYIDSHAKPAGEDGQQANYQRARDDVLEKLSSAFRRPSEASTQMSFLSFLGYPPVLDAIATLLLRERNYLRIQQALNKDHVGDLEADLLVRISDYLLDREHNEKAVPLFIEEILRGRGLPHEEELSRSLYNREEQCARILAKALSRPFPREISWPTEIEEQEREDLNSRYDEAVESWSKGHPFLKGEDESVRNPVFAAVAIMHCTFSDVAEYRRLAHDYANLHSPTHHLVYIMNQATNGRKVSASMFNALIQSSSDLLSVGADIFVDIDGQSWEDGDPSENSDADLTIDVRRKDGNVSYSFGGKSTSDPVAMGPYLINSKITLPCPIQLSNSSRVVIYGECSISAPDVLIDTPDLSVRAVPGASQSNEAGRAELFIDAQYVRGHAEKVSPGGGITIQYDRHQLGHTLATYGQTRDALDRDLDGEEQRVKFLRLKRLLMEFAARGQGGLARSRIKIENRRVLRSDVSDTGQRILDALKQARVVTLDGSFYRLDTARCSEVLGVSWQQLRQGKSSPKLVAFLTRL